MFKLMIVDDNPYILQELNEITDWENFDFDLRGLFLDARELLEAAKKDMPDVVITDISMPVMDGMQLSSLLYQINPNIKIIFISEYSEFEYARKALHLHIFNYLLKPISLNQLTEVLKKAFEQLQKEQQTSFEQQNMLSQQNFFRKTALSHYISRLFFHTDDEQTVCRELSNLGMVLPDTFSLYVVCYSLKNRDNVQNLEYSSSYFRSLLENELTEAQIFPAIMEQNQGAFLLLLPNETDSVSNLLSKLCIDIEAKTNLCLTLGYSNVSSAFESLPKLYSQAQIALERLMNTNAIIPVASYMDNYIDVHSEALHDLPSHNSEKTSSPTKSLSFSKSVEAMRSFIQEHYMEQITINDVARAVYLSPSYANLCFNRECGITIFNYIVQCRMEQAKHLLTETEEQITLIAELAGYSGKTSFYLAFKRYTGISPTEYRKKYR